MKRLDQINVVPFIDIMLVLLAIVLATASFIVEGRLQIRLPSSAAQSDGAAVKPVEIAVDATGELFFRSEPLGSGIAGLKSLEPRLNTLAPSTPIVLRVDAEARFEWFVAVVDRLKGRGLERLTISTRQP